MAVSSLGPHPPEVDVLPRRRVGDGTVQLGQDLVPRVPPLRGVAAEAANPPINTRVHARNNDSLTRIQVFKYSRLLRFRFGVLRAGHTISKCRWS
eukprot:1187816-Prorocentrum_minimum.AAC.3